MRKLGSPWARTAVAYLIAQIALIPEAGPVPPGGEFPSVGQVVGPAMLIHATPWRHDPCSDAEREAGCALLQECVSALPRELWRDDG